MKADKSNRWYAFQLQLRHGALALMRWLAGGVALLVLLVLTMVAAGWLLFTTTWQPLTRTVGLPPVVAEINPAINETSLQEVRAWGQLVNQRSPQLFPRADQVIVAGPR